MDDIEELHTEINELKEYNHKLRETLRDKFAMAALTGLLDNIGSIVAATGRKDVPSVDMVAGWAYDYADAMLKAREES